MTWPLAYFLTWTTYGSHLHGDERGSIEILPGRGRTRLLAPSNTRQDGARALMRWPETRLSPPAREVVHTAITDHAALRTWRIDALNVRSNHVHVVVDCRPSRHDAALPSPEKVMEEFKSWGTRRLRQAKLVPAEGRTWTDHGSTRWLNHQAGHIAAITYVSEFQDDPDRFEYERRLNIFLERLRHLDDEWRRECEQRRRRGERGGMTELG